MTTPNDNELRTVNRDKGIAYARAAGIAVGIFLLAWLPLNTMRWEGYAPPGLLTWETVLFALVGGFMLLPWKRFRQEVLWRLLFGIFSALVVSFVFTLVIDLIVLYMHAAQSEQKPPPTVFQSLLLFIVMMQPPTLLFQRHPELLD